MKNTIIAKLLVFFCFVGLSLRIWAQDKMATEFRLINSTQKTLDFNPQQNIFKPTTREKAREVIIEALTESAFLSIVPLLAGSKDLLGEISSDNLVEITKNQNYLEILSNVATILGKNVLKEMERLEKEDPNLAQILNTPIIHDVYFWPWKAQSELFYDSHKVSMAPKELLGHLKVSGGSEAFEKILTKYLSVHHQKVYETSKDPVFLLGIRYFFFLDMKGEKRLTLRALLGLRDNPDLVPNFRTEDPKVVVDRIVIPKVNHISTVASLQFNIDLRKNPEIPTLDLSFGEFKEFKDGSFILHQSGRSKSTPRLEGKVNRGAPLGNIALNFSFTDMTFDLTKQELTEVDTLIGPGIRIGKTNYVFPGFNNQGVDEQFKAEINKTIKQELEKLMKKIFSI